MSGSSYGVREIDGRWNEQMLSIAEASPMVASGLEILTDHRPDIFLLPRLLAKDLRCAGFFFEDQLKGFAMMLAKTGRVDGEPEDILYFCNLFVEESARRKGFVYRVSDVLLDSSVPEERVGHALILRGNDAAMGLLNRFHSRFPNMPHSKVLGQWAVHNILMTPRLRLGRGIRVRPAEMEDLDGMIDLLRAEHARRLFAPVVTRESVQADLDRLPNFSIGDFFVAEKGGDLLGVCRTWDMTPIRKTRVLSYGANFAAARRWYGAFAPVLGLPPLPGAGEAFREVVVTDYAVRSRNPDILRDLLSHVVGVYRKRGFHLLQVGCGVRDPLSSALRGFFCRSVISNLVVFSKSPEALERIPEDANPWIDMAFL